MAPDNGLLRWDGRESRGNLVERLGAALLAAIEALGRDALLLAHSVLWFRSIPKKRAEILRQMSLCGVMSFPVVVLVSIFSGGVLALQAGLTLRPYGIEAQVGAIVGAAMVCEMGPIMTGIALAGRVGAAMAAELGTMRAAEEIDALEAMSIDPVRFLVMPRLVAMLVMAPALIVFSDLVGVIGGALVAHSQIDVSYPAYFDSAYNCIVLMDIYTSVIKAIVFGGLIVIVSCGRGLRAQSSAEGVGQATKESVVVSCILLIVFNYLVTSVMQHFYPATRELPI